MGNCDTNGLSQVALDFVAEGIGTVKDHELLAEFGADIHGLTHRGDECVGTTADVLNVIDEDVHILEHLGGRTSGLAVDRVDGHAGGGVGHIVHMVAGMNVAAHAVLGGKESREFHTGSLVEDVHGALQVVVDAGGICDEAHTFALQALEAAVTEHLHARLHVSRQAHAHQGGGGNGQYGSEFHCF